MTNGQKRTSTNTLTTLKFLAAEAKRSKLPELSKILEMALIECLYLDSDSGPVELQAPTDQAFITLLEAVLSMTFDEINTAENQNFSQAKLSA